MSNYDQNTALDARDFLGNYLKKEDVVGEMEVQIVGVHEEEVAGESRPKLAVRFAEFQNPMLLNSTNIKRLCKIFRTTSTSQWRGPVTLYVDHDIEFGGKTVGGLRLRPARSNGGEAISQQQPRQEQYQDEDFI